MGWLSAYSASPLALAQMIGKFLFILLLVIFQFNKPAFSAQAECKIYNPQACAHQTGSNPITVVKAAIENCALVLNWHHYTLTGCAGDTCGFDYMTMAGYSAASYMSAVCTCPVGSSLQNDFTCKDEPCPAGYERVNGQCVPECAANEFRGPDGTCQKDCSGKQGQQTASYGYNINGVSNNTTVAGCQVHCVERVCFGTECSIGDCKYTGKTGGQPGDGGYVKPESKPDPTKTPPTKPSDCGVKGDGYIQSSSGSITCVPSQESPTGQPTVSSEKSTESGKPDASGNPDKNSSDYKREDVETTTKGSETTTKKTSIENPDAGKNGTNNGGCPAGTSLIDGRCYRFDTTVEATSDFCTRNPNALACKKSSGNGNSNSDTPSTDECIDNPDRVGCKVLGTPPTEDSLGTGSSGVGVISPIAFGSAASCPPDIPLPRGATLSFKWPCDFASALRPVLLAIAWLTASLIVVGAFKGN